MPKPNKINQANKKTHNQTGKPTNKFTTHNHKTTTQKIPSIVNKFNQQIQINMCNSKHSNYLNKDNYY